MNYRGVIIEESLETADVLREVRIVQTKVESVTEKHQTPWLKQWTLHTVEIPEERVRAITENISQSLDRQHGASWYADFKNDFTHFIIFRNKIFQVDRSKKEQYETVVKYGRSLGIPDYQLDFSPDI